MKGLTAKQRRVLEVIRQWLKMRGQPPTVREIGLEIGVASSCTVQRHLDALERKGFIKRDRYKYRSIELADTPYPIFTRAVNVPILGSIAAGAPILAQEHIEDTFALPANVVAPNMSYSGGQLTVRCRIPPPWARAYRHTDSRCEDPSTRPRPCIR